ncbi:hypothetical protein DAPPUDRAFT_305858 [Daphnia pulex]|uniref:Uncharacterized protein n=1 Tax=Daphnia pulex TaxID=6669 RepID=E9I418_DAPPU|nr:hypothetical protein DAPPUDRAFT_305858 [Daphnia pulex]|eukprot:EFX61260.1 hypothetical protein DAPPUDRAFT_305858 [Daphnia pulex]
MNAIQRLVTVSRLAGTRQMSSAKMTPELAKIRAKQEFFQLADGNMVHEKTPADRVAFFLTSALIVAGMGMTLKFYYDFAFPKKA